MAHLICLGRDTIEVEPSSLLGGCWGHITFKFYFVDLGRIVTQSPLVYHSRQYESRLLPQVVRNGQLFHLGDRYFRSQCCMSLRQFQTAGSWCFSLMLSFKFKFHVHLV